MWILYLICSESVLGKIVRIVLIFCGLINLDIVPRESMRKKKMGFLIFHSKIFLIYCQLEWLIFSTSYHFELLNCWGGFCWHWMRKFKCLRLGIFYILLRINQISFRTISLFLCIFRHGRRSYMESNWKTIGASVQRSSGRRSGGRLLAMT